MVPKVVVETGGRNDVVLAGLNHKMGYRGTTNTMLNFGEGVHTPGGTPGAVGFLVGEAHRGLSYMFHMMNEARIGVGGGATALGYTGYLHSLAYARQRPQGRRVSAKDPASPQVPIIEHPDVRRMLLAQKSYVEGALALNLYCGRLVDEEKTAEDQADRARAHLLLDVLTPVAKSWPSQWCLEANSLAIQVLGGYGYTREYPVEQFYRDNRLNAIHEGTHGIQGLDLLGRKVVMQGGAGLALLATTISTTISTALSAAVPTSTGSPTRSTATTTGKGEAAAGGGRSGDQRRAGPVGCAAADCPGPGGGDHAAAVEQRRRRGRARELLGLPRSRRTRRRGLDLARAAVGVRRARRRLLRRQAAGRRYFFRWELPRTGAQLDLLDSLDVITLEMADRWF